ncbi:hypothetical protein GCM10010266_58370 [Streptomyces griseomycini]|uniref:hypothetical protein n=1 Tax=Streptomyces griseomycini TaxID=66895 RepID=UPI001876F641|nr:hypothetical protein [Streptomyces griseomycini]GGQ27393.1 hypothetical protein GCM10010266_58370 [Streptomyces griseomycini]
MTDRTGCGNGWHGHRRQVLMWFLGRRGIAPDTAQDLVDQAIGGRFLSRTDPDVVLVEDVAERLALSLRPDAGTRSAEPMPDHLERRQTPDRPTAAGQGCATHSRHHGRGCGSGLPAEGAGSRRPPAGRVPPADERGLRVTRETAVRG